MDYLDPLKKRRKKTALMVMYALIGIAIAIATVTLVYWINGYSIDRSTGEVIQNGLIYIDSKPESAEVYLNGEKQKGRTDLRLVVPEGTYDIELSRSGYRGWARNFVLEGGSLRRLTYARLVPETLDSEVAVNLPSEPTMTSQSIDKRWLVMAFTDNPLLMRVVDINRAQFELINLPLPLDILDTKSAGVWEVVDWADDNKTFLATYTTDASVEYVLINREDGTKSKKLKTIFPTVAFSEVSLFERKNDLLYLFDSAAKVLYKGDVNTASVEVALRDVVDYMAYGSDSILYITSNEDNEVGMVTAMIQTNGKTHKLRTLKQHCNYLLAISKLSNHLVLGIGSPAESRVIIYNDPLKALKDNDFSDIPVPTTVLRVDNPEELIISADSSCIMVHGIQRLASHEFEADRSYSVQLEAVVDLNQKFRWIDGQHLLYSSGGSQYMTDFDGSNQYELVASVQKLGSFAERNFDYLYTFKPAEGTATPAQLIRTYMRTAEDR